MPLGPGGNDAQGVYLFGEADTESLASDLLNRGMSSVSVQLIVDRLRLTKLEARAPFAMAAGLATGVTTAGSTIALPAGRFTQPPIITLGPSYVTASGANGAGAVIGYVAAPTTTNFKIISLSGTVNVHWVAVQMLSGSAAG